MPRQCSIVQYPIAYVCMACVAGITIVLVSHECGCGDVGEPSTEELTVLCRSAGSDSTAWSVSIQPESSSSISLSGDLRGTLLVSNSAFSRGESHPSLPWRVEHEVEVIEDPNSGFRIMFDKVSRKGTAGTREGAWELARSEFMVSVAVEIATWIQGEILAPASMVLGRVRDDQRATIIDGDE